MTLIQVRVHRPSDTGTIPAGGQLEWTPTAATSLPTSPVTVILPAPFTVNLTDDINEFTAIETGPTWAWRVVETFPGQPQKTRHVLVTGEGPVDYTTLPSVDPATLEPAAQPDVPVWYAYVDALEAEAARSADAADLAKAAALAAQASATGSATAASQSATNAAARAVEAGTSAFNAGSSAASAAGHVTTAQQAASNAAASVVTASGHATNAGTAASAASTAAGVASGHATAAAGSATAAAGSASASQTARLGAEAARDRAELVATAFTIGDVFTSEPGAPASAVIHGEGPFRELDLTLPRGVQGPPLAAYVADTVTGPETPGATGMQGAKGDKGDPGPWTTGTALVAEDLNTIQTPGQYRQFSAANATPERNYPFASSGSIEVMAGQSATELLQRATPYSGNSAAGRMMALRRFGSAVWSSWSMFRSTRLDQTAGRAIYAWDEQNNRDQLVYGDTGFRQLTLENGYLGGLYIRRVGPMVNLTGTITRPVGGSLNGTFYSQIHIGFRPQNSNWVHHPVRHSNNASWFSFYRKYTEYTFENSTGDNDAAQVRIDVTWMTTDPWPTTLPGIASGTIPNL
ncbi:minor tail protein [Arthrobacter phage Wheelbite]|uniref:Minor tail protein n=1 Tax=Arthrobacter phage Wheelbite TaxID=2015873 RepID=A0A222ZJB4_9CAUD|nr:minor tail protein [Arthrobacter phage Wheelbite]ASR84120.1 minor tail protein [Arthrobacter phage Wheelbite]